MERRQRFYVDNQSGRHTDKRHINDVRPGDLVLTYKSNQSGGDDRTERWCLVIANANMSNIKGDAEPTRRLLLLGPGDFSLFTRSCINKIHTRRIL